MDELEPWPEDDEGEELLRDRKSPASDRKQPSKLSSPDVDAWRDKASSQGSASRDGRRKKAMFSGPPPPIAGSMVLPSRQRRTSDTASRGSSRDVNGRTPNKDNGITSLIFDYRHKKQASYQQDSVWRGLRRRERALHSEVQQLLDLQAGGLKAAPGTAPSETDSYSDTGSSTPTGTFYSTATSKSRMVNSLYIPPKSTADGNVIPVRQPKSTRPKGLKSARAGLRRSIGALAKLKAEEDEHVDDALAERKKALSTLKRLSLRQENVTTELKTLEEDEEEPLGQELRGLGEQYDTVNAEIRELDTKLKAMRNQRAWLREKMDDVKNRREAGLSGYRGALKDVDAEVDTLMQRPPVQPLDLEALDHPEGSTTGGREFMKLIPERRTLEMAKSWWESETSVLERRKAEIDKERQGLEEGSAVWGEVTRLVSDYESRLRQIMKGEQPPSSNKGKEKTISPEEMIRAQLPEMEKVVDELRKHQERAEDKGWTLLICAIGAELEAFIAALDMLKEVVSGEDSQPSQQSDANSQDHPEDIDPPNEHEDSLSQGRHEESDDNEVPADLLISRVETQPSENESDLKRTDSASDVPAEFLAEHKKLD